MRNQTKTVSIVIIGIIYLIAILLGYFVFRMLNTGLHELVALFLADVVATVVVWGFGLGSALQFAFQPPLCSWLPIPKSIASVKTILDIIVLLAYGNTAGTPTILAKSRCGGAFGRCMLQSMVLIG